MSVRGAAAPTSPDLRKEDSGGPADPEALGCPFINAIGKHDKADERLRAITIKHKSVVLSRIKRLAAEANMPNPGALAHQIGLLIYGAIIAAWVTRNPKVADDAASVLRVLIGSEVPLKAGAQKRRAAAAAAL